MSDSGSPPKKLKTNGKISPLRKLSPSKMQTEHGEIPYPKLNKFGTRTLQQLIVKDIVSDHAKQREDGLHGKKKWIDKKEVETAFRFFDINNKQKISHKDLKRRLQVFYPHMSNKEFKFLIPEQSFTVDHLLKILEIGAPTNFDPMRESFKVFDPNDTGFVDTHVLRLIMSRIGYGHISDEDLKVMMDIADVDKDGKISFQDWCNMVKSNDVPSSNK